MYNESQCQNNDDVFYQVGDRFKIVLDKGSLGVQGGRNQFISFLGHLVGKISP